MTAGTSHQAIYRRWRAQTFSEIVGQEAVVATLRNAVATGQVAHAILFTGPRGTGKTSLARILAKALNCQDLRPNADPCDVCPACVAIREGTTLDVIEMDAATNRGIDNIRDLRERLNYPPGELRRKVYILDEAHQITRDAWNALLKSLEEPPDFIAFMFASTHPQEFPPAILSRLQRFDVRRLTVGEISGKLDRILAADGREADPGAVALVAHLAAGGMRDAESILDQLLGSTTGRIEAAAVRDLLGLADADMVEGFVASLGTGDAASGIALLDRLEERGRDLRQFLDQVVDSLRARLLADLATPGGPDPALAAGARRLGAIDMARLGPGGLRFQLELALLEASDGRPARAGEGSGARHPSSAPPPVTPTPAVAATFSTPAAPVPSTMDGAAPSTTTEDMTTTPAAPVTTATPKEPLPVMAAAPSTPSAPPAESIAPSPPADAAAGDDLERIRSGWAQLTGSATPALRAVIVECRPVRVEGNVITLGFPEEKPFMQGHAERSRSKLEAHFGGFLGHDVAIRCVTSNLDLLPPLPADDEAAHILAEAQRIFAEDLADVPEVS